MHAFEMAKSPAVPVQSRNGFFRSVYIVLLKAKINLLLPFGPSAILLHYLTRKHVSSPSPRRNFVLVIFRNGLQGWVFVFSLIGITPLAERLGYATE